MQQRRRYEIFIVGKLLLLNWLASNSNVTSARIYDHNNKDDQTWLQQKDAYQNFLIPSHYKSRYGGPRIVLPEEIYDEAQYENTDGSDVNERLNRNDRSLLPEYRNLCESVTRKVELKSDPNYEYQPPHYHEVFCKSHSLVDGQMEKSLIPAKQKCAHPSFHCVQRSRTIFMVRRRWDGTCWEPMTRVVASGCDCMWPVSSLGDVSVHY